MTLATSPTLYAHQSYQTDAQLKADGTKDARYLLKFKEGLPSRTGPVTADGPSSRKMLALDEQARKKNLKVGVGLMGRHCRARGDLFKRIQDGAIGEIILMRAYRMHGPIASAFSPKNDGSMSDLSLVKRHAALDSGRSRSPYRTG